MSILLTNCEDSSIRLLPPLISAMIVSPSIQIPSLRRIGPPSLLVLLIRNNVLVPYRPILLIWQAGICLVTWWYCYGCCPCCCCWSLSFRSGQSLIKWPTWLHAKHAPLNQWHWSVPWFLPHRRTFSFYPPFVSSEARGSLGSLSCFQLV